MIQSKEITISINKINIFSFLVFLFDIVLFVLPYYFLWKSDLYSIIIATYKTYLFSSLTLNVVVIILAFLLSIVLHEFLHGLTWSFFTNNGFKDIKFGIQWKTFTPYCHCTSSMKSRYYLLGVVMPFVVLGLIPSIIAIISGNLLLLLLGMFFVISASGDILVAIKLLRENPSSIIKDHSDKIGYYVYDL